ncbi:MAG: oxidoreductase [Candidatus Saccharibacteria bacterium]|nr:oxidoreductase [Candidatus Saccharibacteria bacterium]
MQHIDDFLDRITMYRLVVYVLLAYVALAMVFAFMGKLSFSATDMVLSLALLLIPAFVVDKACSYYFRAPTNSESWLITSLIMFLIIQPADSIPTALALITAGALSSASKFLFSWNNKHIFNPAALAAAVVSLTALQTTTWWIGNSSFWPFTLVLGFLIIRKIRMIPLFVAFIVASVGLQLLLLAIHQQPLVVAMKGALLASPLLFLATIMLTEPATMPPRRNQQVIFAVLVAVLYVTAWGIGPFIVYPEVALLLGNIYAFAVSPKFRVRLHLQEVQRISDKVYNYVFQPERRFGFMPGQYMEWTLAGVPYDSRGNRRMFTIASSPTEDNVQIGVKYHSAASAYKTTLWRLRPGDVIYASQLAGNFTLDANSSDKLAFIAGGIGITPFRSMVKYLVDNNLPCDIIILYVVPVTAELAYLQEFRAAQSLGVKLIPIVSNEKSPPPWVMNAKLDQRLITQLIPDASERLVYVSGPSGMVDATKRYLRNIGVAKASIKTDHFTGY